MDCSKMKSDIAIVLDFDGTMCRLFKNYDIAKVVVLLCEKMEEHGVIFALENDSFDVFSEVVKQTENGSATREKALMDADMILSKAEIEAVDSGELVTGVETVLPLLVKAGFPVGIATNNSVQCVTAFMNKNCSTVSVPIVGRIGTKPELMKPNAWSLLEVLRRINCSPENAVFVGDTQRDFYCSKSTACRFIGMASTDKKRKRLLQVMPESDIVSDFKELLILLQITI